MSDAGQRSSGAAFDAAGDIAEDFRDPVSGDFRQETMIINMGPQHPSTHGVLRLLLELDGETVIRCKPVIGYLHTGIEKNTEYRTWVQGITLRHARRLRGAVLQRARLLPRRSSACSASRCRRAPS